MSAVAELRKAILDRLAADGAVTAIVGARIYDRPPASRIFPDVSFGYAQAVEDDELCIRGYEVAQQIDVWSRKQGSSLEAERAVQAITDAIHDVDLTLPDPYALSELRVVSSDVRDDPDGITVHGMVSVIALIEQA